MFKFKQFIIEQEGAPFKVGTDSMILGAWTCVGGQETVLDLGTGTGVLALMIAQRIDSGRVLAIEPERSAFEIAEKNIKNSDFSSKVIVVNEPLQRIKTDEKFDLIITNPPYFIKSTKSLNSSAMRARHTEELKFEEIVHFAKNNLSSEGRLSLILPKNEAQKFQDIALKEGLYLAKELKVSSYVNEDYKRRCMEFCLQDRNAPSDETLVLRNKQDKSYTQEYKKLTKEYHTRF